MPARGPSARRHVRLQAATRSPRERPKGGQRPSRAFELELRGRGVGGYGGPATHAAACGPDPPIAHLALVSARLAVAIPHAIDRFDRVGPGHRLGDLAPEVLHVAVDGAIADHAVVGVDGIEQLGTGEHVPRPAAQGAQQAEFDRRELETRALPARLEALLVELEPYTGRALAPFRRAP